jgi:hypothetical protein
VRSKSAIAAVATAAALAAGGLVASKARKPDCVMRLRGVTTCLRDLPAHGSIPAVRGVLMSEGTPFPAAEAVGSGCAPAACPRGR